MMFKVCSLFMFNSLFYLTRSLSIYPTNKFHLANIVSPVKVRETLKETMYETFTPISYRKSKQILLRKI